VAQFVGAWRATTQILELGFAKFGPRLAEHSGWFGRVLFRGMQNEPAWNELPPFQKYLYEVGQNTLRSNVYQRYSHIVDSVAKGRAMVTDFGYIRATFGGGFRKISAEGTMQTGATPGGRWLV